MKKIVLIAIYDHPDKFPPTLNAIKEISSSGCKVIVLCRNTVGAYSDFKYSCQFIYVNDDNANASIFHKLFIFLKFTIKLLLANWRFKPHFNLVYDCYSLSTFKLIRRLIPKTKIWYHNHDVTDLNYVNKKSLTYWCWRIERRFVRKVDIFSLPDLSRAKYFIRSHAISFLPNYPNLSFNPTYNKQRGLEKKIKVLYQGRISTGHGIFELIKYIQHSHHSIEFHVIGSYDVKFEQQIKAHVTTHQLLDKIFFYDALPYHELKLFSRNFDVGLGISQPLNLQYATAASASNKIYEYAALGMPVILFDNEHYHKTLQQYDWAKFTNITFESLDFIFADLIKNCRHYGEQAFKDYRTQLHFEKYFYPVYKEIIN